MKMKSRIQASLSVSTVTTTVISFLLLRPSFAFAPVIRQERSIEKEVLFTVQKFPCLAATKPSDSVSMGVSLDIDQQYTPPILSSRGMLPLDPGSVPPTQLLSSGVSVGQLGLPIEANSPECSLNSSSVESNASASGSSIYVPSRGNGFVSVYGSSPGPSRKSSPAPRRGKWLQHLSSLSNAASLLCVVDCTLLPLATIVVPLLGVATGGPAEMEWLHSIDHAIAIFFVMPVGSLVATTNYVYHRRLLLTLTALVGLSMVYLANTESNSLAPFLCHLLPHDLFHSVHSGTALHHATNTAGCALMLASNFFGRKQQGTDEQIACIGGRFCGQANCRRDELNSGEQFFQWERPRS